MNYFAEKTRIIFVPFLLIATSFIVVYTFLHWLLFINLHLFAGNEDTLDAIVPLILPWLPILIWFRKRTKILATKTGRNRKGDPRGGLQFTAWIAIAVPTIIAQSYLETATGKLTVLENVSHIKEQPVTKYYSLKHYYIPKSDPAIYSSSFVSGKHNEDLNFRMHIVLPVLEDSNDNSRNVKAWYGIEFSKRISNRGSSSEKEAQWNAFISKCQTDFENTTIGQFVYLENIGITNDREMYAKALLRKGVDSGMTSIILLPREEAFEARNGNKLFWVFGSLAIGVLLFFVVLSLVKVDTTELAKFQTGIPEQDGDAQAFFDLFIPNKKQFITPIIVDLNILVFLLMAFKGLGFISFQSNDLIKWGADYGPITKSGEWWRLLTSTFLHGGVMHLLANMYGLIFVGIFLEPVLGRLKYAVAYLLTGIIASMTSLWWHDATVSVGASGAIFGMYGVFLALMATKIFSKELTKAFLLSTIIFVGYNLAMGMANGIDNAAHIGGLVSGFIIGLVLYPGLKQKAQ